MNKLGPLTNGMLTIKSVRVNASQINACLDAMDHRQDDGGKVRRQASRFSYRTLNAVVRPENEDKTVAFVVSTRNISVGGMSVLHSQMMYPGTGCTVELATHDGKWLRIKARVAHCRLVRGMLHEIGLKFDKALDVQHLTGVADTLDPTDD